MEDIALSIDGLNKALCDLLVPIHDRLDELGAVLEGILEHMEAPSEDGAARSDP